MKQDLVAHARGAGAEAAVMDVLEAMPDREYGTMADVMEGFGEARRDSEDSDEGGDEEDG